MKVIGDLGGGGFGHVELVEDTDGSQYARKTFRFTASSDPTLIENVKKRFDKEARIQKAISHRNIVPVISSDLDADPPSYLMPVASSSLDKEIKADRLLGGNWLTAISDIVSGLEELHSAAIFHRDLKPNNVLGFTDAAGHFYAISDFGLVSRKESQLSSLTFTGMQKGSDHYTAPEIVNDFRKASIQSDIFSLGCIIHDMVGTEDRVPLHEIKDNGPYGAILLNCTRANPARRFGSVRAVLDALLSIDQIAPPTPTSGAANLAQVLDSSAIAPTDFWASLADFVDGTPNANDLRAIFMRLGRERIEELVTNDPVNAKIIGLKFAEWVTSSAFDFNMSDGIADRLDVFVKRSDAEVQAECLLALLEMGTSHNRWYVERMFMARCAPDMPPTLAKRLAIEIQVRPTQICGQIAHVERSITTSRSYLHPAIVAALEKVC